MQILSTVFVLAILVTTGVHAEGDAASAPAAASLSASDPTSAPAPISVNVTAYAYAGGRANQTPRPTLPPSAAPASAAPPASAVVLPLTVAPPIVAFACPPAPAASAAEKSDGWQAVNAAFIGQIWILLLLGLIFWSAGGKALLESVSSRLKVVSKFKGAGIEMEFSEAAAKEIKANVDETLKTYLAGAQLEYDHQASIQDLTKLMRPALEAICKQAGLHTHDLRTTLYVEDVVYKGFLYQLVGYLIDGRGKGRRFSERYGIIGRAWRMERSILSLNALGTAANSNPNTASPGQERVQAIEKLVESWGMTLGEAEHASQGSRKSYLCVILKLKRRKVGLLYVDAVPSAVFERLIDPMTQSVDEDSHFAIPSLEELPEVQTLSEAVEGAMSNLRQKGTRLSVHNQTD